MHFQSRSLSFLMAFSPGLNCEVHLVDLGSSTLLPLDMGCAVPASLLLRGNRLWMKTLCLRGTL